MSFFWAELLRSSPFTVAGIEGPCTARAVDGNLELRDRYGRLVKSVTRAEFAEIEAEVNAAVEQMRAGIAKLASGAPWIPLPPLFPMEGEKP